jgi:hypothetical protein
MRSASPVVRLVLVNWCCRRSCSGAARVTVASLAEERELGNQRPFVGRAVRVMTRGAVLAHRRVLPQEWPPLLSVAIRARLVDRVAHPQQPDILRPVRVVAGRTLKLAFPHRHVARSIELGNLVAMTRAARLEDRTRLELFLERVPAVRAVARCASQTAAVVLAACQNSCSPRLWQVVQMALTSGAASQGS